MGKKSRVTALALALAAGVSASPGPAKATESLLEKYARIHDPPTFGLSVIVLYVFADLIGDDPAIIGSTSRHDPWKRTINGSVSQLPESRSHSISTMAWIGYDLSDHIGLPPNHRLAVGGFYRHDWISSTQTGIAETSGDNNALGLIVAYQFHAWHAAAAFEIDWGDGKVTGVNNAASGSFDTKGRAFGVQVGRVFTLSGDPRPMSRTEVPWAYQLKQASIYIDPVFRFGYGHTEAGAFTPIGNAAIGKEIERAWTIGGAVTLSAIIPAGAQIWRPYISFGLDRQLGYRHTIDLPATGQVASLDQDKTYWSVNGGVGVWLNPRLSLGVSGFYRGSGSQDTGGGLFWLRANLFGPGGYLRGGIR